jgi:predicted acyl esterase
MRAFKVLLYSCFLSFSLNVNAKLEPSVIVHVPMRDGLELTTDLYYPAGSSITDDYPCILLRLPGGRKAEPWVHLSEMANEGYVVAIQDTRSALDKDGKTLPFFSDGWEVHQDGYDTVNWLAASSFTNGKIGTLGYSAAGITQLLLAPTAPSALKCQYIGQAPSSLYHHVIYPGGNFQKHAVELWFGYYAPHPSVLETVKTNSTFNELWKTVDALPHADKVEVPSLHFGGWFDPFIQGTIDGFNARQSKGAEGAKGKQKLLIGPWNHYWPHDLSMGDYKVPVNGQTPPLDLSSKRWFDYYLKDEKNDVSETPPVTYFVMGSFDGSSSSGNVWRHTDVWPVPAVETPFYLTGERMLSEKLGTKDVSFDHRHDPENPVLTIGGRNLFLPSGPKDQRPNEEREDVLVFTTAPLEEDLEVTGRLLVKLFLETKVPSVDVAVHLTDVYPDGKSLLVAEGTSHWEVADVQKSKPQEVVVDLWSTSFVFAKGHSIRISIAGSNYPRFENNSYKITTGAEGCKLLCGKNTPSCVLLPIVRKGTNWLAGEKPSISQ